MSTPYTRNGMALFTDGLLGKTSGDSYAGSRSPRPLLDELVSIAAACAVNSVADLETHLAHLAHARNTGATEAQVTMTLSIARIVKRVAAEKIGLAPKDSPDDRSGASVCSVPDTASHASASPS